MNRAGASSWEPAGTGLQAPGSDRQALAPFRAHAAPQRHLQCGRFGTRRENAHSVRYLSPLAGEGLQGGWPLLAVFLHLA